MEPGTGTNIPSAREAATAGGDAVAPPGPRKPRAVGEHEPENPDEDSNIIRGED
ncbi:hypothetical protein [Streptomyces sp. NBC_00459]|uniref:hypothetical protein n=1 Tax=Streptomyces sp. NBC_00459 TaxID=2975749 RepID=UPI002E190C2B